MRVVSDDTLAILNCWMESRGETFNGMVAVCEVMRNRAKLPRYGNLINVILAPYQFSGWNTKDPNRIKALLLDDQDATFQRAVLAWNTSKDSDLAHGATLYYNPKVITTPPAWAKQENLVARIGNHEFYLED